MKPSREELQAQVESLEKKRRSAKSKVPTAPESSHVARGKVPKLGASSSLSPIREEGLPGQFRSRGPLPHPVDKVLTAADPHVRSPHAVVATNPPGRTAKLFLDILPISIWSPSPQSVELPSGAFEGEGRKNLSHERAEDSLLENAELAAGALSSILQDSNLKKADSMSIEEAMALSF